MGKKKILFLGLLSLVNYGLKAQTKQVTNQGLYWMRYYNQLSLNEKWTWHNEIEERRFFENNRHHHLIMHTRLHYKFFKNADLALGFTYSLQSPQDPNAKIDLVVPELRPGQEVNFSNPITKRLTIQQRFRIDERFIQSNNGKELTDGYDFNFRFRYRLLLNYKLNKDDTKLSSTIKLSDELMLNAGKNIIYNQFDQNRIYVGFEQGLNKNFSAELGYLYWYQQRSSGYQFFDRDIVRLTIYHKIKL
jgi:Protein of unknown function (DUF2490)